MDIRILRKRKAKFTDRKLRFPFFIDKWIKRNHNRTFPELIFHKTLRLCAFAVIYFAF